MNKAIQGSGAFRMYAAIAMVFLAISITACEKPAPASLADYPGFWVSGGDTAIFVSSDGLTVHLSNLKVIDSFNRTEGDPPLSCEKTFQYAPGCGKGVCLAIIQGSAVDGSDGHVVFEGELTQEQSPDFDLVTGILFEPDQPDGTPTLKLSLSPRSAGCLLTDQAYFLMTTLTWAPDSTHCPAAPECLPEPAQPDEVP
ncbi:MAG TPA: hypothetical protein PKH54_09435 [Myxococcota bacterium]|nr:hypothetical protein [Myxococcota bacterium]